MLTDWQSRIARIIGTKGHAVGAAFVVTGDGWMITCAHVVIDAGRGPGDLVAFYLGNQEGHAEVISAQWRSLGAGDVAILRPTSPLSTQIRPLPLAPASASLGRAVTAYGFPEVGALDGLWGRGEVVDFVTVGGARLLQLRSGEITVGFSGGPVWDEAAQCAIGMVSSIAPMDRFGRLANTAFATPMETLQQTYPDLPLIRGTDPTSFAATSEGLQQAIAHLCVHIEAFKDQAQLVHDQLRPSQPIWPEDCTQARVDLLALHEPIARTSAWLDAAPLRASVPYLPLISALGKLSPPLIAATHLIDEFGPDCWRETPETGRQRVALQQILHDLIRLCTEVLGVARRQPPAAH